MCEIVTMYSFLGVSIHDVHKFLTPLSTKFVFCLQIWGILDPLPFLWKSYVEAPFLYRIV